MQASLTHRVDKHTYIFRDTIKEIISVAHC